MEELGLDLEDELLAIARKHFDVDTLETRRSDRLDFHDVAVWNIRAALLQAYQLGKQAAAPKSSK